MPITKRGAFLGAIAPLTLVLAACSGDADTSTDPNAATQEDMARTLATMLAGDEELSAMSTALSRTGISTMLDGPSSYTLLAPTNAAFEAVSAGELLNDEAQMPVVAGLLREHIIPGALTPESIRDAVEDKGGPVTMRTLGSGTVTFSLDSDGISILGSDGSEAKLASGAVVGNNGVLFPIDGVLAALPAE